ncbi:hypothetical protein B9Z55_020797 [Caenorhabditis nigoni]|uniref:Uncharacterized protein n=1 Tax=Caenorhabditis nigoni TaxID=1611254 RepID=A0A2G5TPC9_9PELO|nr:hypothetical protein B9Z55_020797 [Caenorhabditis nigoni]
MDPNYSKDSKADYDLEKLAKEFENRNPEELLAARGAPAAVEKTFPPTSKLPEVAAPSSLQEGVKEKVEFYDSLEKNPQKI